ncbi:MAG TPA: hypothetical protein PLK85_02640 [Alphaproteobacteria bacterium]|nr:hypothetical protein [Alphaproteobacteria bacterium]
MITEHQGHMPKPQEFDFSIFDKIFEEFPSFCDPAEEKFLPQHEGLVLLLKSEAIAAYLTWCLTQKEKFRHPLSSRDEIREEVTPDFTNPNHIRFLKDAYIVGRERLIGTLPLAEKEYSETIKNLQNHPQLYRAVKTLKNFLSDYVSCINEKSRESILFGEDASEYVQKVFQNTITELHNAIRTGFLVEFAALVGMGIKDKNVSFPAILHRIFAAPNAFKAVSVQDDVITEHRCPFAPAATNILTTQFSGEAHQETADKIAGGILVAILEKYHSLESPRPKQSLNHG